MKKFFNIILQLLKAKFEISLPSECDILCYDKGKKFNNNVKKIFKSLKFDVLYVRLEKINLLVAIKSIISKILNFKLSLKDHYIVNYCHYSNPKIILSTSYLDRSFLNLKKNTYKNYKTVLVQRCPYKNSDFNIKRKKPEIDQTYLFNQKSLNIIKNNINSKEFILGSFNNNNQKKNKKKTNFILIISGYKKNFETLKTEDNKDYHLNAIHEKKIIKVIINNLSEKYKIKILLKPDVKKSEYLNFSGVDKKYVIVNDGNPYKIMDQCNLVITFNNGTMGHESISRKVKNIQIPRKKKHNLNRFYIYKDKFHETKIKNYLLKILRMSQKSYFYKMKKFQEDIIFFDYRNTILRKNLFDLIKQR